MSLSNSTVYPAQLTLQKKQEVEERQFNQRKKAFDGEARLEIEAKSIPKVPQTATGNFNLDGKSKAERDGDLTKAILTVEIQLRGGLLNVTERVWHVLL